MKRKRLQLWKEKGMSILEKVRERILLMQTKAGRWLEGIREKTLRPCLAGNEGMGTVEVILIIVVLIGLVVVFKKQINVILNSLFGKITDGVDQV